MHTQRTADILVSDILLSHIRQNATLPMAWSIDEGSTADGWMLVFEHPSGGGMSEFHLLYDTPWQRLLYSITWAEEEYRSRQNQRTVLPTLAERGVA